MVNWKMQRDPKEKDAMPAFDNMVKAIGAAQPFQDKTQPQKPQQPQSLQNPVPPTNPTPAATSGGMGGLPDMPKQPVSIRNQDTGELTGVTMPNGDSFVAGMGGISQKEIRGLMNNWSQKNSLPAGSVEGSQVAKQKNADIDAEEQALKGQALAGQLSNEMYNQNIDTSGLTPTEYNRTEAARAVISNLVPTALTGIGAGAGVAALGGGAGAASGAGIAAGASAVAAPAVLAGLAAAAVLTYRKATANLKEQASQEIAKSGTYLTDGRTNLNRYIKLAQQDPQHADVYYSGFMQQLDQIERAYGQLQVDTQSNANKWLGEEGRLKLNEYESFYSRDGQRDILIKRMMVALANPDSNNISDYMPEDLYSEAS